MTVAAELSSAVKIKIHKKVQQNIVQKISSYNQIIKQAINHIETNTKKQVTAAFFKPYQIAFPMTIMAILIGLMFEKKKQ